jgi:hypothetical protein
VYVRAFCRSLVVLFVIGTVAGGTSVRASVIGHRPVRLAPASSVVLGSSFQPISGVTGFEASGDYVLLSTGVEPGGSDIKTGWTVTDERTGATTALDPQCQPVDLGPPWLVLRCPQSSGPSGTSYETELYSLTDGSEQAVTPSPGMPPQCPPPVPDVDFVCTGPAAVGADWIEWDASCEHDCGVTSYFQNIQTGQLLSDPTNATTVADLNSPNLAQTTCPGVSLMRGDFGWDPMTVDGQFALVHGAEANVYLERCGTRMQRQLIGESSASGVVAWNAGAVAWESYTSQGDTNLQTRRFFLSGLFLPSLQTFTIPLPAAIIKPSGAPGYWYPPANFVLTSRALYVQDGWDGSVWRTASPTALPLNTTRPSVSRSGSTLTCNRGRWREADHFSYAWLVNGVGHEGVSRTLAIRKAGGLRRASCSVTASNADGTTTATSAQLNVR